MHSELQKHIPFCEAVAKTFGRNCEVLIHDVTGDLDNSLVWIINKHVTGREIGAPLTDLGLYFLQSGIYKNTNYLTNHTTESSFGKVLKSSSIFIKDQDDNLIGIICINFDTTDLKKTQKWINEMVESFEIEKNGQPPQKKEEQIFANSLAELIESAFDKGLRWVGKRPEKMQRQDKLEMVRYLYKHGVFLVSGTVDTIADKLNVSRYTIYNYLAEVKKDDSKILV